MAKRMKKVNIAGLPIPIPKSSTEWIVAGGVVGGLYLFIANPLLKKMGIIKGDEDRKVEKEIANPGSAFSPNFWKTGPAGTLIITEAAVQHLIDTILNSVNQAPIWMPRGSALWLAFMKDNFNQCLNAFKQLKTQSQVSYLSDKFQQRKNQDILTWLRGEVWPSDRFSNEEISVIIDYVKKLPKYKV